MSRWVEFIFVCLRIEFVHCVYWECALFLAVLAPCSANRVWREPEDDTAPKKARGAPESVASPGCAKGDSHFAAKIIVLFFVAK